MRKTWFTGLVAATFTPMHDDGRLDLGRIPAVVEHLLHDRVGAIFVCGSTGEGPSMTTAERKSVAEAYLRAVAGRLPVIVHVGHSCLTDAADLAAHAAAHGAAAISAVSPYYFKPASVSDLVASLAQITAAAPDMPFYYYHIPSLSGAVLSMVDFLKVAGERLPTLAGLKYSAPTLWEFQACLAAEGGRYNMLFGTDEMLLSALAAGTHGAVGSTYNFAAPLYRRIIAAFEEGRLADAQALQLKSAQMILTMVPYGVIRTLKPMMKLIGVDCGPTRLPHVPLCDEQLARLRGDMESAGFFDWARTG
jgi:N-acetylneuraminate lyase